MTWLRLMLATIILAVVAFGVILLAAMGKFGFSLNKEIAPVDVLTLAVGVFIAYYLQYYVANKSRDLRIEKDILIDSVRESVTALRTCRDALLSCCERGSISRKDSRAVLGAFRQLSNTLDNIQIAINQSQLKGGYEQRLTQIIDTYLQYKSAATGGSFPSKPFTPGFISDQEQAFRALNSRLQDLIFCINRHN